MSRQPYTIDLQITLAAPYLVHGNDPGRYGLDATLMKDHRDRPVLPGTLVAGRIVEAWHNLGNQLGNANAAVWFGLGGNTGSNRARLMADDLVLQSIDGQPEAKARSATDISRIRLDDDTGAVETGALLIIEQIASPGSLLKFAGTWRTWAMPEEIDQLLPQLRAALLLQTQLGAYRGVGFGRVKEVAVTASPLAPRPLQLDARQSRPRLALTTDRALCVGSRSRRGNVFESDEIITGGSILGALATMLASRHGEPDLDKIGTPLAKHFSLLRCTHALPAKTGGARPLPLPQSLVSLDKTILDAWKHPYPPANLTATPAFQTDWKGDDDIIAEATQGWGETRRHLRVRTDIDGNGQAKEGALFAYECVAAPLQDSQPQTEWQFELDLSGIPDVDRAAVHLELADLLGYGLFPLGKTDAAVTVQSRAAGRAWRCEIPTDLKEGGLVPLLLVTDALLFPTNAVADKSDNNLLEIYRLAFSDLAEQAGGKDALQLSHFFATQRLAGGGYLQHRFQKEDAYQPWVLTEAGSVFVFEVRTAEAARKLLQYWADHGLGLPGSVQPAGGTTWETLPYLPQTGYGEVAIAPQHGFTDL